MNNFLETNIKALEKINPLLVTKLKEIKENQKYDVFVDSDPVNINIVEKESKEPVYISKPVDETLKIFEDFKDYTLYPFLYFFGIGNGIFYKLLLKNQSHKRVVVIDPEIELIYIALHFADFKEEIESLRLIIMHTDDCSYANINQLIANKDAKIYSKLYNIHIFLSYYNRYTDILIEINKIFIRAIEHNIVSVGNDATDAVMGLDHHVRNIPYMLNTPTIDELVNKGRNSESAVIVSTGPSLHKQLPILREIQEHVTILCIDASLPILEQWGIKPDIVLTIERIPLTAEFYKKTSVEFQEGIIFAITSLVHKDLRDSIKAGVVQMSTRPFGYTRYFDLVRWGYLGIGMSAANMAYELAVHTKFKRVVFIGQDLAYGEDGNSHSKGYILDKDEFKPSEVNVYVEKYGGGDTVRTNNIWKMFLNFFENDIANTPIKLEVINSTEGGARIHGSLEIPFAKVASEIIDKTHKKEKIILEKLPKEERERLLEETKIKVVEMFEYGYSVKKEVEDLFLEITEVTKKLESLNEENRLEEIDFDHIQNLIEKLDKIKDYFLDSKFLWIFIDAVQSYIIHQELEIAKIQTMYVVDDMKKKAKLIDWIYAHKYWLFSLAGGMDAVLETTKKAASEWMEIPQEYA